MGVFFKSKIIKYQIIIVKKKIILLGFLIYFLTFFSFSIAVGQGIKNICINKIEVRNENIPDNAKTDDNSGVEVVNCGEYVDSSEQAVSQIYSEQTAPGTENVPSPKENKNMNTSTLSILIVAGIIILLYLILRNRRKTPKKTENLQETKTIEEKTTVISQNMMTDNQNEEIMAAIAMAIHLYENDTYDHEVEQTGFRIDKKFQNSSWSNKAFNIRKLPIK